MLYRLIIIVIRLLIVPRNVVFLMQERQMSDTLIRRQKSIFIGQQVCSILHQSLPNSSMDFLKPRKNWHCAK